MIVSRKVGRRCRLTCLQPPPIVICNFLMNKAYNMLLVVPLLFLFHLMKKHKTRKINGLHKSKKMLVL